MSNQSSAPVNPILKEIAAAAPLAPSTSPIAVPPHSVPRKPMRVLALCDSPAVRPGTAPTGFARVARNLFEVWTKLGVEIEIWGIGFEGWGYRDIPWKIYPAGNADWNSPARLTAFLNQLATGGYTHVWMLNDMDALCIGQGERSFPNLLRACCQKHGIRSCLYFPIDANNQEPTWTEILLAVDMPVTFTAYGRTIVHNLLGFTFNCPALPHGLEPWFQPTSLEQRLKDRQAMQLPNGEPFAGPNDFVLLNVNKNEWRKDILRTLEITRGLIAKGVPAKLILRMSVYGPTGISIHEAARQLGLVDGKDYVVVDPVPEPYLVNLYHLADVYLTTTLGEGWGLGITEALGCGVPVAIPRHTSCEEIGDVIKETEDNFSSVIFLETDADGGCVCGHDSRLRRRVDVNMAVTRLERFYRANPRLYTAYLSSAARGWLSWERVANEFLKLMWRSDLCSQ